MTLILLFTGFHCKPMIIDYVQQTLRTRCRIWKKSLFCITLFNASSMLIRMRVKSVQADIRKNITKCGRSELENYKNSTVITFFRRLCHQTCFFFTYQTSYLKSRVELYRDYQTTVRTRKLWNRKTTFRLKLWLWIVLWTWNTESHAVLTDPFHLTLSS